VLHLVEGYTVIYLQPSEFANWQSESNFTNGVVQIPHCVDTFLRLCSLREEHNSHVSLVNSRLFEFQKGLEHLLIDFSVIVDSYVLDCFVNKP